MFNYWNVAPVARGTFTPSLTFGGAAVGITYGAQTGSFARIGPLVFVAVRLTLTSKGSSTGIALISGLPFVAATVNSNERAGILGAVCTAMGSGLAALCGVVASAATGVNIENTGAGTGAFLVDTDFTGTSFVVISGVYLTDAP